MNVFSKIILAFTLCMGQFVCAQEPVYKWGEPNTNDFPERKIGQLLALGDQGFVVLRQHRDATYTTHYWLESYNNDLKLQGNQKVVFNGGVMGDSYNIEDIHVVNGKMYAFVAHWNKSSTSHSLAVHQLLMDGTMEASVELDVISAQKMGNKGFFNIAFSDDGTKLLVMSELAFVKKTKEKLRMTTFEVEGMKKLWSHEEELNFESEKAYNNYVAVDNKGQAYMFKRKWLKPEWKYSMYSCDGKSWNEYGDLGLEGKEVVDYELRFNKKNAFILYCTYTTKPSGFDDFVHGSLFVQINPDLKLTASVLEPWGTDMIAHFRGEKNAASAEEAYLQNFYVKDLLFRDDGNMLVLMEQLKTDKNGVPGTSPVQWRYDFSYGNFLAVNVNGTTGKHIWWQTFQKNQSTTAMEEVDEFGSYVYHLKNDRLYVIWNNTALSVPSVPPAFWKEPDGTKYIKHKAFDTKTMHASFMQVIEPDGMLAYENRTFGLPLFQMHAGASFEMSMMTSFFFELNGDLVVMSQMHNGGKRYRFGFIGL